MRPLSSAAGPPPLRESFFTPLLRGEFFSLSLAPVFVGAISLPPCGESAEQPTPPPPLFRADEAASSAGGPPPFVEIIFTELLRGEFSISSLAPVFVGAISSPLCEESAEHPPSPPP